MKNLNIYIKEGLADWSDDELNKKISKQTSKAAIKQEIMVWVAKNTTQRIYKNKFKFNFDTTPVTVDYLDTSRIVFKSDATLTNDMFQWGEVGGFIIYNNPNIINFEGGPKKVRYCSIKNCPNLESLEDGPEIIGYEFICENCPKLEKLPKIKEASSIRIKNCQNIKYINDCPDTVNIFRIMHCGLVSLEGGPKKAHEYLVSDNKLTSLKGAPEEVTGDFVIDDNPIISLKGGPEKTDRYLCRNIDIKNLEGGPKTTNVLSCGNCGSLVSLKGVEKSDINIFYCDSTNISTLEYCPNVNRLHCGGTKLTNLEFLPKTVANLTIDNIKTLKSLDGLHDRVEELSMINVPFMKNIRDYNIPIVYFK